MNTPKSQAHEKDEKAKLKEVREYSLALYRHLQQQLKSRQLLIPQRRRIKRRRITRDTPTGDMYSREPRNLGSEVNIERMLSRGANFVPPVDPKKLRAALDKLLQLAESQKKKGFSYLKPSGPAVRYSKEEYEELNSGENKDISLELANGSRARVTPEKLQNIESFGTDASLPSQEDDADNNKPIYDVALKISGNVRPYAQSNQGHLPPAIPVDTLAWNPSHRKPLDNQNTSNGRGSRYPDDHICPFLDSEEVSSTVSPTVPTRPTIPELDLIQTETTTTSAEPTTTTQKPDIHQIPGFVPTTLTPASTQAPSPLQSTLPIIDEYFDDEFTDLDDYDYNYKEDNIKDGVDPGLKRTEKLNYRPSEIGNKANSNEDQRVIILVEPQGTNSGNSKGKVATFISTGEGINSSLRNFTFSNNDSDNLQTIIVVGKEGSDVLRPTSSPIILIGPGVKNDQRGIFEQHQLSKDTNWEGNTAILIDENTDSGRQTQRKQRPIPNDQRPVILIDEIIGTAKLTQRQQRPVILVDEDNGTARQNHRQQRPGQEDKRPVILVEESPGTVRQIQRQQRPRQEDKRPAALVDENTGTARQTRLQQRPRVQDKRPVILVDDNSGTAKQTQLQQRPREDNSPVILVDESTGTARQSQRPERLRQEDERTVIVIDEKSGSARKILRQQSPQGEHNAVILINEDTEDVRQKERPRQEELDTVIVVNEYSANGKQKQRPEPDDQRTVTLVNDDTDNERTTLRQQRPRQEDIQTLTMVDEGDYSTGKKQKSRQKQQTVIVIDDNLASRGTSHRPPQEQNTLIIVGEDSGNARQPSRLSGNDDAAVILVDENSGNTRKTLRPRDEENTVILLDESQGTPRERLRLRWKQSTSKTYILLDGGRGTADEGQQEGFSYQRGRPVNSQTVIIVDDGGVDGKVANPIALIDDNSNIDFKRGSFNQGRGSSQALEGGQTVLLIQPERLSDWREVILIEDEDDTEAGYRRGPAGSGQTGNEHKAILLIQSDGETNGKGILLIEGDGSAGPKHNRLSEGNVGSILRGDGRKIFTVVQPSNAVNNLRNQSRRVYNQTVILLVESEDGKYENIGEGVLEGYGDRVILLVDPDAGPKPFNRQSVNSLGREPAIIPSSLAAPPHFRPTIGLSINTFTPRNNPGVENLGEPLKARFKPRPSPAAGSLLARTRRLRSRRRFPSQDYVSIQEHQASLLENEQNPRNRGPRRGRQRVGGGRRRESSDEYGTGIRDRRRGSRERSPPRREFLGSGPEFTPSQNPFLSLRGPASGGEFEVTDYSLEFPAGQRGLLRNAREFTSVHSDLLGTRREEDNLRFSPETGDYGTSGRGFEMKGPQVRQSNVRGGDEFTWSPFIPSYLESIIYPNSRHSRDRPIPEKISELRHAIESRADAWTHAGLQRTRPEFRRHRRTQ